MEKVFTKEEVMQRKEFFIEQIKNGKTFFYPTDTVYGLGCDAFNKDSVKKIFELKKRGKNAVSVIAPNKQWIRDNCDLTELYLDMIPGKYTLLVQPKKDLDLELVRQGSPLLGVRIPNNWFCDFLRENGFVFITTSANISGKKVCRSYEDLDKSIFDGVDFIIDDGKLESKASTVLNALTGEIVREE